MKMRNLAFMQLIELDFYISLISFFKYSISFNLFKWTLNVVFISVFSILILILVKVLLSLLQFFVVVLMKYFLVFNNFY